MRTIFVRVISEPSASYAPVPAEPITSTTFTIDTLPRALANDPLEFGAGDRVRCRVMRLVGPDEGQGRQRMVAVERLP